MENITYQDFPSIYPNIIKYIFINQQKYRDFTNQRSFKSLVFAHYIRFYAIYNLFMLF